MTTQITSAIDAINFETSMKLVKRNIADMPDISETPFITRVLAQLSVVKSRLTSLIDYVEMVKNLKSMFKKNSIVADASTAPLVDRGNDGSGNTPVSLSEYKVEIGDITGHGPYFVPITLTAKDLPKHYNSGGMLYHWTGIGVSEAAETDTLQGVCSFYSTDENLVDFSDKTFSAVSDVEFTVGTKKYRSYYFGFNPENPNRYGYVVYKYEMNEIPTYVVYRITFDVEIASE